MGKVNSLSSRVKGGLGCVINVVYAVKQVSAVDLTQISRFDCAGYAFTEPIPSKALIIYDNSRHKVNVTERVCLGFHALVFERT